jgi:hypothetical protein
MPARPPRPGCEGDPKAAKGVPPKAAARGQQPAAQQAACLTARTLDLLAGAAPLNITIEL